MLPAISISNTFADGGLPETHPQFGEFVERYIPVVRNIVERFKTRLPAHVDLGDLFSVGVTGLIAAASNYSEERAATFGGYVVQRIRGAILDELRKADTRSRRARMKARMISEVTSRLEQQFGRPATAAEIRGELGLSPRVFAKWQVAAMQANFVSLDSTRSTPSGETDPIHETIADESAELAPDDLERSELCELLAERIGGLPENQRKVLALYYHEGMRFAEIAKVFEVSESRICQIHGQAVRKLREQFLEPAFQ